MLEKSDSIRDLITIEDEQGVEKQYEVEALFDMNGESYALLRSEEETILMRVEDEGGEQFLVGIEDESERDSILDAYEIAVDAAPAE
ncbi:DUF1292 domain-containing protein [Bacillus sp. T33-2]|uniref:DUF1292 domain-containing protein n=1 Tax=Bacillus sp. T33-2 TaxID=2054168 RepID=UPI000C75A6A0|nr:DUF1292 domain-containing protein [Bacillus sp. T33-2]PLR98272.1 DUF1292 domain-containing protein [Bacillus sp. T33-2]